MYHILKVVRKPWYQLMIVMVAVLTGDPILAQEYGNPGYIVYDNGEEKEVYFQNEDYIYSTTKVLYRDQPGAEIKEVSIDRIKEFRVPGSFKFIRARVEIDRSFNSNDDISSGYQPVFTDETIFLRVIVEGGVSLFSYEDKNADRYFMGQQKGQITQLIYKKYNIVVEDSRGITENVTGMNDSYKEQIKSTLQCSDITDSEVKELSYNRSSLTEIFASYYNCKGTEPVRWSERKKSEIEINARLRSGLRVTTPEFNSSSVVIANSIMLPVSQGASANTILSYFIAGELEFSVPISVTGLFSGFTEITYMNLEGDLSGVEGEAYGMMMDFQMLRLQGGTRYYYPVSRNLNPFLEFSVAYSFLLNESSSIRTDVGIGGIRDTDYPHELILGIGLDINRKFNVLARYGTILTDSGTTFALFNFTSISVSYNFL